MMSMIRLCFIVLLCYTHKNKYIIPSTGIVILVRFFNTAGKRHIGITFGKGSLLSLYRNIGLKVLLTEYYPLWRTETITILPRIEQEYKTSFHLTFVISEDEDLIGLFYYLSTWGKFPGQSFRPKLFKDGWPHF